jgi:hypothetical protein
MLGSALKAVRVKIQAWYLAKTASSAEQQIKLDDDLRAVSDAKTDFITRAGEATALIEAEPATSAVDLVQAYSRLESAYFSLVNRTDDYCRKVLRLDLAAASATTLVGDIIQALEYQPEAGASVKGFAKAAGRAFPGHRKGHTLSNADKVMARLATIEERDRVNRARLKYDDALGLIAAEVGREPWWKPIALWFVSVISFATLSIVVSAIGLQRTVARNANDAVAALSAITERDPASLMTLPIGHGTTPASPKTASTPDELANRQILLFDLASANVLWLPWRDELRACVKIVAIAQAEAAAAPVDQRRMVAFESLQKVTHDCGKTPFLIR